MTYVDVVSNTWFYCDTLGWNPPSDLKKEINRVLEAIDNIHCLPKKPFKKYFNCHVPSSTNVYHHNCSSKCFKKLSFSNMWQHMWGHRSYLGGGRSKGTKYLAERNTFSNSQSTFWFKVVARSKVG